MVGEDHKALPALDLVDAGVPGGIVGVQFSRTGYHVMEQIMVAGRGTENVGRFAALSAELIQAKIHKIFVGKDGEDDIAHKDVLRMYVRRAVFFKYK